MIKKKTGILVMTPYPLLPANSGGRLYALSTIEPLADEYDFHLLAIVNAVEKEEFEKDRNVLAEAYSRVFRSIHFEERPQMPSELKSRWKVLRHLVVHACMGLPLMDVSYYQPKAVRTAKALIKEYHIDMLEMHHLHVAFYRRFIRNLPAVLVNHNIESEVWPFWPIQQASALAKKIWNRFGEISRRNAFDIEIGNKFGFDAKFFISNLDMAKVNRKQCPLYLLPMSIKIDRKKKNFNADKFVMLWMGGFFWQPNTEAAIWFMYEIWPLIKKNSSMPLEVHFVGSNPPNALSEMHDGREVFVHGYVQDVEGFREKADAFIVPLRTGGGVRIKIVEALNAGIPVVTTSKGCEGLPVEDGKQLLIADEPQDFAGAVLRLVDSLELREELSRNGREYCSVYHSPEKIAGIKRQVYESILGKYGSRMVLKNAFPSDRGRQC